MGDSGERMELDVESSSALSRYFPHFMAHVYLKHDTGAATSIRQAVSLCWRIVEGSASG